MAAETQPGLLGAIRIDLQVLHETWMEFLFPRQRNAQHTVLGKWQPETTGQQVRYYLWALVGVPLVAAIYPLLLAGYFVRFQTGKIGAAGLRLGFVGVVVLVALVWGGLTALVAVQSAAFQEGAVLALALASGVAVVSAALSVLCWRVDGRATTILLAYPFAVTAIFLPPVVAALFWEPLDGVIQFSDDIAYWVTNEGPDPFGVVDYLERNFERQEEDHIIIWFVASFPVGWVLGLLVTLADLVRPRSE
jgi:hypothetical protein